jgi:peptide/nickel transport system substrate-binding protein
MFVNRVVLLAAIFIAGCGGSPWNNPYPASERGKNILYTAFTERPKHLDPVQSYSSDEADINAQIYEPPLQYHYFKRPYSLIPATAVEVPTGRFLDAADHELPANAPDSQVAYTVYEVRIKPGIRYQPHPAFALDPSGKPRYQNLSPDALRDVYKLSDFKETGTRELIADDYVYEIKRLAHPRLHSPIFGLMSDYIVGLREYAATLKKANDALAARGEESTWLDLRQYPLAGAETVDRYTYHIKVKGKYPQLLYWLAMPFFAPVPVEVDHFFSQPGMLEKNLTLDWYPVGTGPYMLTENNPNARMVLERNPNFHDERYPSEGEPDDVKIGLLADGGKRLPFVDKVVFTREKESIPYWNKFLQGYYDSSGISSDNFDQAVRFSGAGEAVLTPELDAQGIKLSTAVATTVYYMAFNMVDPVVGGLSERNRKLRQAISIAIDWEENISIFANGRGIPAMGPLAPGIFGFREGREGLNPAVYDWVDGAPRRKPIEVARKLLAEAGYPDGRDAKTGQPLVLYLDVTGRGPDDKSRFDWYRKQFAKLNIQLEVRATDYNRFQDKVRRGAAQIFTWGWNADYPDPENFLFLLHTAQSRVKTGGENSANYSNPEFDRLFEQMKNMENGPQRQAIIDRMVAIVREDAPWSWGVNPKDYALYHQWLHNLKPNQMARNGIKYRRIDVPLREQLRAEWNQPVVWPVIVLLVGLVLSGVPAYLHYRRRERGSAKLAPTRS